MSSSPRARTVGFEAWRLPVLPDGGAWSEGRVIGAGSSTSGVTTTDGSMAGVALTVGAGDAGGEAISGFATIARASPTTSSFAGTGTGTGTGTGAGAGVAACAAPAAGR